MRDGLLEKNKSEISHRFPRIDTDRNEKYGRSDGGVGDPGAILTK